VGSLVRDVWRRSLTVIFMADIGDRALCSMFNFNAMFGGWGIKDFNLTLALELERQLTVAL